MKTTILADGTLSVAPETDLEAFALNCWCEKNINRDWFNAAAKCASTPKIIVDLSAYADRIGLFLSMPA